MNPPKKTCVIIGSGIAGLASAILLADQGYAVTIFEKNEQVGGRASRFTADGLVFDAGPSWYLMPDVFQEFFSAIGEDINHHITLVKLSPSYRVFFEDTTNPVDIFSNIEKDKETFESIEPGSGKKLEQYLRKSEIQYNIVKSNFLRTDIRSLKTYFSLASLRAAVSIPIFRTMHSYVKRFFKNYRLQQLLQYTLVFLGSSPYDAPALYNIMSHLDFSQGVYYPQGGIYTLIESLESIAKKRGVKIMLQSEVSSINSSNHIATGVTLSDKSTIKADIIIANADMHFVETRLLSEKDRQYPQKYWDSRTIGPSAFLLYLGVTGEIPSLTHHNLYFNKDWKTTFTEIFKKGQWPSKPSLYVSNPSKTDPSVSTAGVENVFVLIPLGAGVIDSPEIRNEYTEKVFDILEHEMGISDIKNRIIYKRDFGPQDFSERYYSFKGSALGLSHTLRQSAFARPYHRSNRLPNLYYTGAGVHPGIGLPVCLISAQIVANDIHNRNS